MITVNWPEMKAFLDLHTLGCQYVELTDRYIIHGILGTFKLECEVNKNSSDVTDFETNYKPNANKELVTRTVNSPSAYNTSVRFAGTSFTAPPNASTTHWYPLSNDYEIRGAEFQSVGSQFGDYVEMWVTDKDGIVYPAGTRLTKYVDKFYLFEHEAGTTAPLVDLVDDDNSDEVPSIFYIEFLLTNAQPDPGGNTVKFISNFWLYERQ